MKHLFRFYVHNRFMYVFYTFAAVIGVLFGGNPYANVVWLLTSIFGLVCAFAFIETACRLNAQERLLLSKLGYKASHQ
jgi:hypothetical protein